MTSQTNRFHEAIKAVPNDLKDRLSPQTYGMVDNPLFEAILVYNSAEETEFETKKQWLRENFGLVRPNFEANPIGQFQREDGWSLENILVYEDPGVEGQFKGAYRIHCYLKVDDNETYFYFRPWNEVGIFPMWEAIEKFQKQFLTTRMYQLGRNYRIKVDFDKLRELRVTEL